MTYYRNRYQSLVDTIIEQYTASNITIRDICKLFPSLNRYTIIRILESEGIEIRQDKSCRYDPPDELSNQVADLYELGKNARDISKELDIPYYKILRCLKKHNLKRTKQEVAKTYERYSVIDRNEGLGSFILNQYKRLMTFEEIAKNINNEKDIILTPQTIRSYIKKHCKLRTQKEIANLPKTIKTRKRKFRKKYGVDNPMQLHDVFIKSNKSRYRFKEFEYKGIKFTHLQGYEPQGIEYLDKELNIDVSKLQHGRNVPKISYIYDNKNRTYFPDFYDKDTNTIFEIKSKYTYENMLDLNNKKKLATKQAGYNHKTLVFDSKGEILKII